MLQALTEADEGIPTAVRTTRSRRVPLFETDGVLLSPSWPTARTPVRPFEIVPRVFLFVFGRNR